MKREELGALTHQGNRVERTLYHSSCITLMLAHSGSLLRRPGVGKGFEISWGLSPVSRTPVDGFLKMPSLSDQRAWVEFIDWRRNGHVDVEDLAAVMAAMLPIDEHSSEGLVRKNFRVDQGGIISQGELALHVLPHLERECKELCGGNCTLLQTVTPFMEAAKGLRLLPDTASLYVLRVASSESLRVVRILFVLELCHFLSSACRRPWGKLEVARNQAAASALALMAREQDRSVVRCCMLLLEQDREAVRGLALQILPFIRTQSDAYTIAEVSLRLEHVSPQVQAAAIGVLAVICGPGDQQCVKTILEKLCLLDASVCIAAIQALGNLAQPGDQTVIRAIAQQLFQNEHPKCKEAAEDALFQLAKGDGPTIEKFVLELSFQDEEICMQSLRVLSSISEVGDQRVIDALLSLIVRSTVHASPSMIIGRGSGAKPCISARLKAAAIVTLGKISENGDTRALVAICPAVHERDCFQVADAAIRSIGCIAKTGDRRAARVLNTVFSEHFQSHFKGPKCRLTSLRLAALEMLEQLGAGGDDYICDVVMSLFENKDLEVRRQAVMSAGKVAKRGDPSVVRSLQQVNQVEGDQIVKAAVQQSLHVIGDPVLLPNWRVALQVCASMFMLAFGALFAMSVFYLEFRLLLHFEMQFRFALVITISTPVTLFLCYRFRRRLFGRCCRSCFEPDTSAEYMTTWCSRV